MPAPVTITDIGLVEPSVPGTSVPEDKTSNFCATAWQDAFRRAGLLDDVAECCELGWQRRSGERLEPDFARPGTDVVQPPCSLMWVLMSATGPPKDHPRCSRSADLLQ